VCLVHLDIPTYKFWAPTVKNSKRYKKAAKLTGKCALYSIWWPSDLGLLWPWKGRLHSKLTSWLLCIELTILVRNRAKSVGRPEFWWVDSNGLDKFGSDTDKARSHPCQSLLRSVLRSCQRNSKQPFSIRCSHWLFGGVIAWLSSLDLSRSALYQCATHKWRSIPSLDMFITLACDFTFSNLVPSSCTYRLLILFISNCWSMCARFVSSFLPRSLTVFSCALPLN